MTIQKLADLIPERGGKKYRTSDEIFDESQKDAGGVKRYTGDMVHPRSIPVPEGAGAFEWVRDHCYRHYIVAYAGQGIGFECFRPFLYCAMINLS